MKSMPEGPEITVTAQFLDESMRGKKLTDIKIVSGRYKRNKLEGLSALKKALPLKILNVSSRGKFMWFNLSERFDIWNTFGLTGMWRLEPDDYTRITMQVGNKTYYFSDMRNFGTFKISRDKNALLAKIRSLSPDFLRDPVDLSGIVKYDQNLVSLLMSQTKLGSGLGNYLVAEILYRAKLSPHRLGSSLTKKEIKALENSIKYTIKLAYKDNDTGYMSALDYDSKRVNYHPDVKLGNAKFQFQVYKQRTDPKGNPVKAEKIINGRTTYWVPAVQR